MSTNNGKFSDNLIEHALGLEVHGTAINQSIAHHHLQIHDFQSYLLTITSFLMIWLGVLLAKGCVVEIGRSYLSLR